MRRSKSDRNPISAARLDCEAEAFRHQNSRKLEPSDRPQHDSAVSAGSVAKHDPSSGMMPSAQSLVAEATHGKQAEAQAISISSAGGARKTRVQVPKDMVPVSGKDVLSPRAVLGVDLRLWLICVYAFLVAINNTSLRPVLPSYVKARPSYFLASKLGTQI